MTLTACRTDTAKVTVAIACDAWLLQPKRSHETAARYRRQLRPLVERHGPAMLSDLSAEDVDDLVASACSDAQLGVIQSFLSHGLERPELAALVSQERSRRRNATRTGLTPAPPLTDVFEVRSPRERGVQAWLGRGWFAHHDGTAARGCHCTTCRQIRAGYRLVALIPDGHTWKIAGRKADAEAVLEELAVAHRGLEFESHAHLPEPSLAADYFHNANEFVQRSDGRVIGTSWRDLNRWVLSGHRSFGRPTAGTPDRRTREQLAKFASAHGWEVARGARSFHLGPCMGGHLWFGRGPISPGCECWDCIPGVAAPRLLGNAADALAYLRGWAETHGPGAVRAAPHWAEPT
jgi:hypothetical protein